MMGYDYCWAIGKAKHKHSPPPIRTLPRLQNRCKLIDASIFLHAGKHASPLPFLLFHTIFFKICNIPAFIKMPEGEAHDVKFIIPCVLLTNIAFPF
jgi:hypothetical protein